MFRVSGSTATEESPYDHVVFTTDDLPAPSGGYIDLTSGSWFFADSVDIGTDTLRIPSGAEVFIKGGGWTKVLSGSANPQITVQGTLVAESFAAQSTNGNTLNLEGGATILLQGCTLGSTGSYASIVLDAGASSIGSVILVGSVLGSGGVGIEVLSGTVIEISLTACEIQGVSTDSIHYTGGTVSVCRVSNCFMSSTQGINWSAASIPTFGMLVTGNTFFCPFPVSGFTAASARVNMKANSGLTGLLSETAIVP